MNIKKMLLVGMLLVGVLCNTVELVFCQEQLSPILQKSEEKGFIFSAFSKNIPDTVYQVAQEVFRTRWMSSAKEGGSLFSSISSDTSVDISNIALSDKPIRVLLLFKEDIVNCESGSDILSKARFRYYTFLVLSNERSIGAVHINKDEKWEPFGYGQCSIKLNRHISELRDMYPESEGYQVDWLGLYLRSGVYWITFISNREEEEYWVTTRSKKTSMAFDLVPYDEENWSIVPLDNLLHKFNNL
ncbi:MAG TPA: hypothetical protein VKO43_01905 [Candidatus Krumholzibacteriaceae bacterium]|nr:hypothetical protein [Candidatus Krumholzibacteriaceae bacterium]